MTSYADIPELLQSTGMKDHFIRWLKDLPATPAVKKRLAFLWSHGNGYNWSAAELEPIIGKK